LESVRRDSVFQIFEVAAAVKITIVLLRVVTSSGDVGGYIPFDQGLPISSEGAVNVVRWLWRAAKKERE
jgi:hypothetical protein